MKNKLRFKAELREIELAKGHSNVSQLKDFKPDDPLKFEIGIEIFVGIEGGNGTDRFDISICTPSWIEASLEAESCIIGHGKLIVSRYSYDEIINQIESYLNMCVGGNVDDVMRRVGLLGEWEYEWEI
ncbi:MAG: Imm8 family immunity protein [Methylococcales bacterium]|nr:Imm8 family immunity protein [Methylococcales bacterium]